MAEGLDKSQLGSYVPQKYDFTLSPFEHERETILDHRNGFDALAEQEQGASYKQIVSSITVPRRGQNRQQSVQRYTGVKRSYVCMDLEDSFHRGTS